MGFSIPKIKNLSKRLCRVSEICQLTRIIESPSQDSQPSLLVGVSRSTQVFFMRVEILTVVGVTLDCEVAVEVQAVDVPEVTCNTTQY